MRKFYSIEYVDDEGDSVIRHAILEPDEAEKLVSEMTKNGIHGCVHDLSPQISGDEKKLLTIL